MSALRDMGAKELSLRLHHEIRAYELRGKKPKGGIAFRATFPDERSFWDQAIRLYESKVALRSTTKVGKHRSRVNRSRELREIQHEIDHFKKKVQNRFDPPPQKPKVAHVPPLFGDMAAIEKSFRKWLKKYNSRNGTRVTLRDYLKRVRSHSSLRDIIGDWASVGSDSRFNQEVAGVSGEIRRTWRLRDGFNRKHEGVLAILREASRLVSSDLEAIDYRPPERSANKAFVLPELQRLPWQLLPGGDWTIHTLIGRLKTKFQKAALRGKPLDEDRLRKIVTWFNPTRCYIGDQEFDGYLVFGFDDHGTVLLECPIYGNAIYLIRGDWQNITRLTKGKSLSRHPNQVKRVIHGPDWIHKLQAELRNWR